MKSLALSFLVKFLDLDTICMLIAKCVAAILSYASKKGGKAWDIAKAIITKINLWTSLFVQVYDDETLTEEEEKLVAEAIKKQTSIEKIIDILNKNNEIKKA